MFYSVLEGDMDDIAQTNALGKSYVNVIEGLAKTHPISAALCTEDIAELLKSDVMFSSLIWSTWELGKQTRQDRSFHLRTYTASVVQGVRYLE